MASRAMAYDNKTKKPGCYGQCQHLVGIILHLQRTYFALPTTVTGSIGVFSKVVVHHLENVGISVMRVGIGDLLL